VIHRDAARGSCATTGLTRRRIRLRHSAPRSLMNAGVLRRCRRGAPLATTHGSATWPDALRPVHRHNEGARELPIGWRSSTIAVALRHMRQRTQPSGKPRRVPVLKPSDSTVDTKTDADFRDAAPLVLGGGRRVSAHLAGHQRVCRPVEPVRRGCGCRVSDIRERSRELAGPTRRVAMGRHHGAGCRRSAPGWIHGLRSSCAGVACDPSTRPLDGRSSKSSCWGSYGTPRRTAAAFSCCGSLGVQLCCSPPRQALPPRPDGLVTAAILARAATSATAIPSPVRHVRRRPDAGAPCEVMRGCRTRACARR
jgi:hypothetical protein